MDIALCYPSVLPRRGGCETYIGDLARRLDRDGHRVHLYAAEWDADALPASTVYHKIRLPKWPRFLRPWRFGRACYERLMCAGHDVTVGFDKTWGQDVQYPQGGLHAASVTYNRRKFNSRVTRTAARVLKNFDPAAWSFARLERKQYLDQGPLIVVNSRMVQSHFWAYYDVPPSRVRVVRSAIDPARFAADDRPARRDAERTSCGFAAGHAVGLFVAMNYRLKGLAPLLRGLAAAPADSPVRLAVVGHPKDGKYRRLAGRLGVADRVRFLGFRADPRDAFFAADFLAHPTFYDPCSLVALEAMACGLPVITTRYNGASELMEPGRSGVILDDPHDAAELAGALTTMADAEFRRRAAKASRDRAAAWTFEAHYRELMAVFTEAAGRKKAAA